MSEETSVPTESVARPVRRGPVFLVLLLVFSFIGGAAIQYFLPTYLGLWQIPSKWPAKVLELQARIELLEKKVDGATPTVAAATDGQIKGGASAEELAKMQAKVQADLAGVTGLVSSLQTQLAESSVHADSAVQKAQSGLATVLAFIEMQKAAAEGRPFEKERQILRHVAQADEELVALLLKLEPVALTGAQKPEALRAEWQKLSIEAQALMRKASAQTWRDRIVVALENLVTIRSLKPQAGQAVTFAEVDLDLARGDLRKAMERIAAFPPEVQESLKAWKEKVETRVKMEDDIAALVSFLIARGQKETQPPQPAPEAKS